MTKLSVIVARAANHVIGRGNDLPWHLKQDLAHFKASTLGQPVIMGRHTWDSIIKRLGKPLPGRLNIVVTNQTGFHANGATVVHSLQEALACCAGAPQAWCIGGARLFAEALEFADELVVSEIARDYEGDTYFPLLPSFKWRESSRRHFPPDEPGDPAFDVVTYRNTLKEK